MNEFKALQIEVDFGHQHTWFELTCMKWEPPFKCTGFTNSGINKTNIKVYYEQEKPCYY